MTITEFLHPIIQKPLRDICLGALYFAQRYTQKDAITVEELRALLKRAHIPRAAKANLADTLAKSAPYVDISGKDGKRFLWSLTPTGEKYVRSLLGLPQADVEIEHDVSSLKNLLAKITDTDVADYIDESIKCMSVEAFRAAVVFLWAGAVRKIQEEVIATGTNNVNQAVSRYDSRARKIKKIDDLAYIKESALLLVAQEVGVYDKSEREVLEDALNLRNKCGHPGKYRPGSKKVSSFIEDVVGTVFDT